MPKYNPSDEDMDMGMYSDTPAAPPAESEPEVEAPDKGTETGTTALVPNKVLSPEGEELKEGDEIVVRVVKNYGDETEIEYAPKKGGSAETEEPMSTEGKELAALSNEKGAY